MGLLEHHSIGGSALVEFDWKEAVDKSVLGFYHTHAAGIPYLSSEDETTMKAWVCSEGRPMLCGVVSEGEHTCWLFYRREGKIRYRQIHASVFGPLFIAQLGVKS